VLPAEHATARLGTVGIIFADEFHGYGFTSDAHAHTAHARHDGEDATAMLAAFRECAARYLGRQLSRQQKRRSARFLRLEPALIVRELQAWRFGVSDATVRQLQKAGLAEFHCR
jgi:hypothetical protein